MQQECYSGHRQKQALNYQAVPAPDEMVLHMGDPFIVRRHDWALAYDGKETVSEALTPKRRHYFFFRDPGHINKPHLETPSKAPT